MWADGRTFTGGFKAGSIEGFGRFVRPDGLVYEGDYVSTKREGHGCLLEADASSYCGEFGHGGKMHGYGAKVRTTRGARRRGVTRHATRSRRVWETSPCPKEISPRRQGLSGPPHMC